jgi:hypothetical protein
VAPGVFTARHPDVTLEIEVVASERANQMLLAGEASTALAFSFKPELGVVVQFTQSAPVMALIRNDHPLSAQRRVALKDLSRWPVLLQDKGTTNRQLFDIAYGVERIEIVPLMTSRPVEAPFRYAQVVPRAIMPSGYVAAANMLELDGLRAISNGFPQLERYLGCL